MKRGAGQSLILVAAFLSEAISAATGSSIQESLISQNESKIWALSSQISASSNLRSQNSKDSYSSLSWSLTPSVQLGEDWKLRGQASGSQQMQSPKHSTLNNSRISLRYKTLKVGQGVLIIPQASTILPTNSVSRDDQSYQGGFSIDSIAIKGFKAFKKNIDAIYSASLQRNIHQFDRANYGESNIEYVLDQSAILETDLWSKLNVTLVATYSEGFTYSGRKRSSYSVTQELSLPVDSGLWWAIGHTYGASTLGPDGKVQDFQLFSQKDSIVYSSLRWTL